MGCILKRIGVSMNEKEIKKISAEYIVWVLDITMGEMTFPDGKKKKVNFFRRSKTRCTLSWDIPHFLNKSLKLFPIQIQLHQIFRKNQ